MTRFERVEGLPLLLRSIAAERQDDFMKELLLCSARQIEALTRRVSHTRSENMLDDIVEELERILEMRTSSEVADAIAKLIVRIQQQKFEIKLAVDEARAMIRERQS